MPGKKSLIVSLHDAHPGSHRQIAAQVEFLAGYDIACSSILVVPEFHHQGAITVGSPLADDLSRWRDAGHELVLHGYFHDRRESPRENLATLFWTRLYTNREAEFLDLPAAEARARLDRGRQFFEAMGWQTRGFVAPAWLMAEDLPGLLKEMGFVYTTRLREIVRLQEGNSEASQSLCYSTRAFWRPLASCAWNKQLFGRLRETSLVRLSLHPRDLEFPLIRRQVDQVLRASLKRGFQPTTYGEHVAR